MSVLAFIMKYFVVIPTYNKKDNIEKLILSIQHVFQQNHITGGVIVVDDNSPDKTYEIVQKMISNISSQNFSINLIHRPSKLGLGSAYITGFKRALELGADYIQQMDADFSHKPEYLSNFYRKLHDNPVVIGSRYIKGGGIKNWSLIRKMISQWGNLYTSIILGWQLNDATAGFVGYQDKF